MLIKRVEKRKDDGGTDATLALSQEQTAFLLNFAIAILIKEGLVRFQDQLTEDELQKQFLNQINPKDMPKA